MDAALQQTLDALLDPARVTWSHERAPPGQEPHEGELFLGVGTREATLPPHPRMLSWKLPQWRSANLRSTTEAVLRSAQALDALSFPLRFRLHDPTLDCTTAAVLATHRVLHHRWPEDLEGLIEYVSEWEQGRTESAGHYERALASVFYASMQVFRTPAPGPSKPLAELIVRVMDRALDFAGIARLPEELILKRIIRRLKADADLYKTELSRGWKVQLDLPIDNQPGSTFRRIDALFLSSPQDVTVLKLLARPDQENSSYKRGFELLAIHAPNEANAWGRHTVSIAPESPGTLADLAYTLDLLEGDTGPDGQPRAKGKPRFTNQPPELEGLSDPWYSDGYAWAKGRSTIVAPPFVGTRLSREELWEAVWQRFNVGRHIFVTSSRTLYLKPFRVKGAIEPEHLEARGWKRSSWHTTLSGFLPSVEASFLSNAAGADVVHLERRAGDATVHLSLYASNLALVWVEDTQTKATLLELAARQAALAAGSALDRLVLAELQDVLEPITQQRWLVYGAYRVNRARSSMLDTSRSVQGLFHALASGEQPTLQNLPSESAIEARRVHVGRDVEHWFTSTGGARLELMLEDVAAPPAFDRDFALFLLTTGQRYVAFEITRRMGEIERKSRTTRWQSLAPSRTLRGDVMLFTNSLWYARVSDDPDLDARYGAWRELHGMDETVDALRSQTTELDQFRREGFENMVGVLLFLFLPITIVSGFFSGAQFNEMDLRLGLPWVTGGWKIFLMYTAFFSALVYGAVLASRLISWRKR
ncbi:MAG: hypothetical protein IT380_09530 [Myxococcales bacterium]|nr:hypothetical protein [Myxococcales bacterium]